MGRFGHGGPAQDFRGAGRNIGSIGPRHSRAFNFHQITRLHFLVPSPIHHHPRGFILDRAENIVVLGGPQTAGDHAPQEHGGPARLFTAGQAQDLLRVSEHVRRGHQAGNGAFGLPGLHIGVGQSDPLSFAIQKAKGLQFLPGGPVAHLRSAHPQRIPIFFQH